MPRLLYAALLVAIVPTWTPADEPKKGDFYPVAKGSKWEYQVDLGGQKIEATSEVTKFETKGGKSFATAEVNVAGQTITEEVSVDDKGVYKHTFQGMNVDKPMTVLKYPLKAGTTWTEKGSVGGMEIEAKYTIKEPEKVTVPAGTYEKAVPVEMNIQVAGQAINATVWYAEGVGAVKQNVEVGGTKIALELKKFTAGK
jgi:hypothetical protein